MKRLDLLSHQPKKKYQRLHNSYKSKERKQDDSGKPSHFNLRLLEKQKVDGTDIMSFKFANLDEEGQQQQGQNGEKTTRVFCRTICIF